MAKAGRPTKPDALKAKAGTLRKDRINKSAPVPPAIDTVPKPPEYLGEEGKKEWIRVADQLDRMGMLAKTDLSALGAACLEWQQYLEHRKCDQEYGSFYVKVDQFGNKMFLPHPNHYNGNAHLKNYLELCREFGLTPAARSKISIPQQANKNQSPVSGLLKKIG